MLELKNKAEHYFPSARQDFDGDGGMEVVCLKGQFARQSRFFDS